jgi:anti-anti-sigma factor
LGLFDLHTSDEPSGRLASLSGEIDLSTVEAAGERLREAIGQDDGAVVIDLREVTFLDSSGLRLLLQLNRELSEAGRRLVIVQGPRRVARVFELTGAESELEVVSDPAELAK